MYKEQNAISKQIKGKKNHLEMFTEKEDASTLALKYRIIRWSRQKNILSMFVPLKDQHIITHAPNPD